MTVLVAVYFVFCWFLVPPQRSYSAYYLAELSFGDDDGEQLLFEFIFGYVCLETIIDNIVLSVKLADAEG